MTETPFPGDLAGDLGGDGLGVSGFEISFFRIGSESVSRLGWVMANNGVAFDIEVSFLRLVDSVFGLGKSVLGLADSDFGLTLFSSSSA